MKRSPRTDSALWFVIILASFISSSSFGGGPKIGAPPPPLNLVKVLRAPDGTDTSWEKLRGKVVVLDFWATWCGPCVASIPHWNELARQFRDKPIVFLAISDENEAVVTAFLKRKPIETWIGLEGSTRSTRDRYGIRGIPTTVIVNQDGIVVAAVHPATLEVKSLQEVLDTKHSSLPPPRDKPPEEPVNSVSVTNQPPLFEMSIRRSGPRVPSQGYDAWSWSQDRHYVRGRFASVRMAISRFFQVRPSLVNVRTELPEVDYDFEIQLPSGGQRDVEQIFGEALRRTFGLEVRRISEERDVFVLSVTHTNAPGLEPLDSMLPSTGGGQSAGELNLGGVTVDSLIPYLDNLLDKPVLDETGLTNRYTIVLKWKMSPAELLIPQFSGEIWQVLDDANNTNTWSQLTESDRKVVAAIQGKLPETEFNGLDPELQERIRLLRSERAKPEAKRFVPDPATIRQVIEEQLGLKLTPARRKVELLAVERVTTQQSASDGN
jgi:uncharacterized protein (TIGR03435 family)